MSAGLIQSSRNRLEHIRLPKLNFTKVFRIRSASKDKNETSTINAHNICKQNSSKDNKKITQIFYSNDKYRSSSLKTNQSKKSLKKKSEVHGNSSDQEIIQVGSCRFNSKINNNHCIQAIQKQHQINMQKLSQMAKLFDPKIIMKMGGARKSQIFHEQNLRQQKNRNIKGAARFNQHVFEGKHNKNRKDKHNDVDQIQNQFWKKVNQSLILAPFKNVENQISKDLRQIYQTLVTE